MTRSEYQAEVAASRARRAARGEDTESVLTRARETYEQLAALNTAPCRRSRTVRQDRRAANPMALARTGPGTRCRCGCGHEVYARGLAECCYQRMMHAARREQAKAERARRAVSHV